MSLKDDYLKLLKAHGLTPPEERKTLKEIIGETKKQTNAKNKIISTLANQVISCYQSLNPDFESVPNFPYIDLDFRPETSIDKYVHLALSSMKKRGIDFFATTYFNEFPTGDIDANVRKTSNGYICLLNSGLLRLLSDISFACCYQINGEVLDNGTLVSMDVGIDIHNPKFQEAITSIIKSLYHYIKYKDMRPQKAYSDVISDVGFLFSGHLLMSMYVFIISHELAHIYLGHLDKAASKAIITKVGSVDFLLKSKQQEIEADLEAQKNLLTMDEYNIPVPSPFNYACGGLCFFHIVSITEQFARKMFAKDYENNSHISTHPSTEVRKEILFNYLYNNLNEKQMEKIFHLLSILWQFNEFISNTDLRQIRKTLK